MNFPEIVTPDEWQAASDRLLVKEKAATRALDTLAAERRRLPMVPFDKPYVFHGPDGDSTLLNLFEGRRQLVVYHFMLFPGDVDPCVGCASFTDNIAHLEHLHARDTTLALVSSASHEEIVPVQRRFGWSVPWYSSAGGTFYEDCGNTGAFGLSVFVHDDDGRVFRTYYTTNRGVDRLRMDFNLLDLTPFGRQEEWEDSPTGWPKTKGYSWWKLRDEY